MRATALAYDDPAAVDVYERLAAPLHFAAPSRHLIEALDLRRGERVLDVGTGTGAAASAAAALVGPEGVVVGVDPSLLMLGRMRIREHVWRAAAKVPHLPFVPGSFDAVCASFVLAHVPNPQAAIADMVAALRAGGRLGLTTWGSGVTLPSEVWNDVVGLFTCPAELSRLFERVIPWDAWFAREANLRQALATSRLERIAVTHHEYSVTVAIDDYLAIKQASVEGVLLKGRLSSLEWARFRRELAHRFRSRFGETLTYIREAHVAVAVKAG